MTPPSNPVIPPPASEPEDDIPVVSPVEEYEPPRGVPAFSRGPYREPMSRYVRVILIAIAGIFATLLITSACLRPYGEDGQPRSMATHMQLGLPPCNMVELTGKPCPSCGMTTAFSLLTHGDVVNSLKANWVGTILAVYWFALIPWAIVSAVRGKLLWVRSGDWLMTISVIAFLVLVLGRWAVVLMR